VPGIVGHGQDVDLVFNQDVVDPIRELPEGSPPDIEENGLVKERTMLDSGERIPNAFQEPLSQT
jgi:hypothetical protein